MLEEYYMGEYILQVGNLSTDGSILVYLTFLGSAALGNNFWLNTFSLFSHELRYADVYLSIFFPLQIVTLITLMTEIMRKVKADKDGHSFARGG